MLSELPGRRTPSLGSVLMPPPQSGRACLCPYCHPPCQSSLTNGISSHSVLFSSGTWLQGGQRWIMSKGLLLGLFPFSTPSLRTGDVRGDFEESSRRNGGGMGQRNVLVLLECFVQRSMAPVFPWGGSLRAAW